MTRVFKENNNPPYSEGWFDHLVWKNLRSPSQKSPGQKRFLIHQGAPIIHKACFQFDPNFIFTLPKFNVDIAPESIMLAKRSWSFPFVISRYITSGVNSLLNFRWVYDFHSPAQRPSAAPVPTIPGSLRKPCHEDHPSSQRPNDRQASDLGWRFSQFVVRLEIWSTIFLKCRIETTKTQNTRFSMGSCTNFSGLFSVSTPVAKERNFQLGVAASYQLFNLWPFTSYRNTKLKIHLGFTPRPVTLTSLSWDSRS